MNEQSKNVKSAERVLDLLELLSLRDEPMRLNDIALTLGYPKSSTHGLLGTLVSRGYVERDGTERYRLADEIREGFNWVGGFEAILRRHALPIMEAARDRTGETVFLSVRGENHDARQLAKLVSQQQVRYDSPGTFRVPAYASVMGRVLLAHAAPEEVDAYLAATELKPFTAKTVTTPEGIRAILADIRARGYGTIVEEFVIGGCGVCAPVRDRGGKVVAVLNIATVTQRYDLQKDEMRDCVLASAAELSARLGYTGTTPTGEE